MSKKDIEVLLKWLNRDCGALVTDGEVWLSPPSPEQGLRYVDR